MGKTFGRKGPLHNDLKMTKHVTCNGVLRLSRSKLLLKKQCYTLVSYILTKHGQQRPKFFDGMAVHWQEETGAKAAIRTCTLVCTSDCS